MFSNPTDKLMYDLEVIRPQNAAKKVIQQRQGNPSSHRGNPSDARVSSCLATGLVVSHKVAKFCLHKFLKHAIQMKLSLIANIKTTVGAENMCISAIQ